MGQCLCGCGGSTGGRFCPGHDAKLKSRLMKEWRELKGGPTNSDARAQLQQRLAKLGWTYLIDPSPRVAKALLKAPETVSVVENVEKERIQRHRDKLDAQSRANVLRELEAFGNQLCEDCGHWDEDHVQKDGRPVCLACEREAERKGPGFHYAIHSFRSLLDEARVFFDKQDVSS